MHLRRLKISLEPFITLLLMGSLSCIKKPETGNSGSIPPEEVSGADSDSGNNGSDGPSFNEFFGVINEHCVICHGAEDSTFTGISNMSTLDSVEDWIEYPDKMFVPGDAAKSAVYNRLIFAKGTHEALKKNMPFATANKSITFTESAADLIAAFVNSIDPGGTRAKAFTDNYTALHKVKYLLNGLPLTESELALTQGDNPSLEVSEIRRLVKSWYEGQGCSTVLAPFMSVSLQQTGTFNRGSPLYGSVAIGRNLPGESEAFLESARLRRSLLGDSFQESFERTFCDLVDRDRPITEIMTTNRWAMTTALLVSYRFVDTVAEVDVRDMTLVELLFRRNITDRSDFEDWRFVNLVAADSTNTRANLGNLTQMRGFGNDSVFPLRVPRMGFFNTLAFQLSWPTNDDNDFRVITNQTLIAALGDTFNAADPTKEGSLDGLDTGHAPANSDCYSCHRLMDPMRQVFKNSYGYSYRPAGDPNLLTAAFAFDGHQKELNSLADMGRALATHPGFASAWVQKVCAYANSQPCDVATNEFSRQVQAFKDSNYNFREMFFNVISSPLVTGQNPNEDNDVSDFKIASSSREQFCKVMNNRYRNLYQMRGLDPAQRQEDLCAAGGNQILRGLGELEAFRGSTQVYKPSTHSTPYLRSGEILCQSIAETVVGPTAVFQTGTGKSTMNLDNMVQHIMGMSPAHLRYSRAREAMSKVYQYGISLGFNEVRALQETFVLACTAPDVLGIGL